MRIFGYLGFLMVWLLAPAPMAITVADTVSVQGAATDGTQSHLAGEDFTEYLGLASALLASPTHFNGPNPLRARA
jgi:hypothetical protein